ncbi:MAG: hypothetical protein AB7F66_17670 [Bacteriovoracia bacterium]
MGLRSPAAGGQNVIQCETRRRLQTVAYVSNTVRVLDIPRDTVIKRAAFYLVGSTVVTYASGSPTATVTGAAEALCPRIDCVIDGQRTVKSITPHIQEMLNMIYSTDRPIRAHSVGTAITTQLAGTENPRGAAFLYPSTTDTLVINEAFTVHFEMPWAYDMGRSATMLNVKNVSSAEFRFSFGSTDGLQVPGGSVSLAYSAIDLNFGVTLIEARDVPADAPLLDFKETVSRYTYSGETLDSQIDLPRGNALAGVGIFVRNGGAARAPFDRGLRDIMLQVNGQQTLQKTNFRELQVDNKERYGLNDQVASGLHALQGFAFMNLLKNGDIRTALNTTIGAGVDRVTLNVNTAPSSGSDNATYSTNPMEVSVWSMEIAAVPVRV